VSRDQQVSGTAAELLSARLVREGARGIRVSTTVRGPAGLTLVEMRAKRGGGSLVLALPRDSVDAQAQVTVVEKRMQGRDHPVLLGVPDRGAVLALPASLPSADRFQRRVLREWRESMNPCSRELLISDGQGLRAVSRGSRTSAPVVDHDHVHELGLTVALHRDLV